MKIRFALGASALLVAVACSGSTPAGFFTDGGSSGSGSSGGGSGGSGSGGSFLGDDGGGSPILTPGNGGDAGANNGCSAASQLVYVLSAQNDIYSFDPPTKAFTKVTALNCPGTSTMQPNSMAVDRDGNAWVNYVDALLGTSGAIFKVNIASGTCAATNIKLTSGWYQLGMGYSTASATDPTDTLYVAATNGASGCQGGGGNPLGGGSTSAGLGIIDTDAGTLTPVGPFTGSLAGQSAELTGTGDGRLYGFFVLSPVQVAQINKASGATAAPLTMTGVTCPQAWAFSFWGGDFYLYTASSTTASSSVTHYTIADGGIDTSYVGSVGFTIVGAGVSTCAPTTPPAPK
jgi:hypothetical protein